MLTCPKCDIDLVTYTHKLDGNGVVETKPHCVRCGYIADEGPSNESMSQKIHRLSGASDNRNMAYVALQPGHYDGSSPTTMIGVYSTREKAEAGAYRAIREDGSPKPIVLDCELDVDQ